MDNEREQLKALIKARLLDSKDRCDPAPFYRVLNDVKVLICEVVGEKFSHESGSPKVSTGADWLGIHRATFREILRWAKR